MGRRHSIEVDVDLDDFSDQEILDEVKLRGLESKVLGAPLDGDPVEIARDLQGWLCTRRYDRAAAAMERLLAAFVPTYVVETMAALREGRYADAICEIDHFIEPPPSREAKMIPVAMLRAGDLPNSTQ